MNARQVEYWLLSFRSPDHLATERQRLVRSDTRSGPARESENLRSEISRREVSIRDESAEHDLILNPQLSSEKTKVFRLRAFTTNDQADVGFRLNNPCEGAHENIDPFSAIQTAHAEYHATRTVAFWLSRDTLTSDVKPFLGKTSATDACLLTVEQFNFPGYLACQRNESTSFSNSPIIQKSNALIHEALSPGHSYFSGNEFTVAKERISDPIENFPVKPRVFQFVGL